MAGPARRAIMRGMLTVPSGPERAEIVVLHSRFIASLEYADSVAEARAFVARVRREFPDASHHVPAFILGGGNSSTEFCADDGEPSGTAGRPLLAALKGSGLGNAAIVVTRYFGGTLLGTGGLVKAYSEAGRRVLERTKRSALVELSGYRLELPYGIFEGFRSLASDCGATIAEEEFDERVRVFVEVPREECGRFEARLADLGSGAVAAKREASRTGRRPL